MSISKAKGLMDYAKINRVSQEIRCFKGPSPKKFNFIVYYTGRILF